MKKFVLLGAMLAMMLVAAVPSLAYTGYEIEDSFNETFKTFRISDDDVRTGGIKTGKGSNAKALAVQNAVNTGSVTVDADSNQSVVQANFGGGDVDQEIEDVSSSNEANGSIGVSPVQYQRAGGR